MAAINLLKYIFIDLYNPEFVINIISFQFLEGTNI